MVKPPTFDCNGMKKGAWSKEEDERLKAYVDQYGHSNWRLLPDSAGLVRCGKSCRLRWMNYLKPGLKRGKFTKHEGDLVIKLHNQLGNRWSAISAKLPGRTDNEIKNYYHAHIKKRGRRASIQQELLQESSSSSEISSSITTTHDQEEGIKTTIDILNPIADLYSFARAQEDLLSDDLSYVDFHPFPEEEFHDFELFQNANLSNSSEDGSSIGEDMLDMILW